MGSGRYQCEETPARADRAIVGKRRTVEFNVKGKLWPILLDRRQTRKLAFEMVRTAYDRGLFDSDDDFRTWLDQRAIPWEFFSC